MIDVKLIRNNFNMVRKNLSRRNNPELLQKLDDYVKTDRNWRNLRHKLDNMRKERNNLSIQIAKMKKEGLDFRFFLKKGEKVQDDIKNLSKEVNMCEKLSRELLLKIPNLLHEAVPEGRNEDDNVEIKRWGSPPKFNFKPKNHIEIALDLDLVDEERANKVAGTGFYYLKNELALLDMAIQRFAIDFLMDKGYTLIEPPFMLRRKPYEGVTDLSDFEDVMYKIEGEDHYLIATSEHPMAAMFMNETILRDDLPIKLVGSSTNFRKEIGAHGKYTKGFFRMHQFNKIEQFIFCLPGNSEKFHQELQKNCEHLYQLLGLHYRVVEVCTGDIGTVPARKYDTQIWMSDNTFREIGSNSNCTDYQSRRLNIKYREGIGKAPRSFIHTLNNTALATSRTMIAILEQHQRKNGIVSIPKPLIHYMNGIEELK